MATNNTDSRCKARTKNGKPCRAAATPGGLCFFHANPNKASELGRIGGRSNGPIVPEYAQPLPALDSIAAVRDAVERLITDVYAGKLHPKIAAGLAPLLQLQLRVLDAADVEKRLSRLERLVTKREQRSQSTGGKWPDKPAGGIGLFSGPLAARDSKEAGSSEAPTEQRAATISEKGRSAERRSPESSSEKCATKPQTDMDPRIQDAAARGVQAELDEQKRSESKVVLSVQDVASPELEQHKSDLPNTGAEAQAPTKPAAEVQQVPAEIGTGATTATKSDREKLEELMNEAREVWGTGKLEWGSLKQK